MKIFLVIVFFVIAIALLFGLYIKSTHFKLGELCIGLSIAGLFFIWMPAFIYHRWKNKDVKDYMLTKENIEKMREEGTKKKL